MFFGYEFESTCGDNINIYIYRMQLLIFFLLILNISSILIYYLFSNHIILYYIIYRYDNKMNVNKYMIKDKLHI